MTTHSHKYEKLASNCYLRIVRITTPNLKPTKERYGLQLEVFHSDEGGFTEVFIDEFDLEMVEKTAKMLLSVTNDLKEKNYGTI
jgi:hypothetical protein